MKKNILFLLALVLAGCASDNTAPVVNYQYPESSEYACAPDCDSATPQIRYATPNGNDLVLETSHHIIHIDAAPGVDYEYYVWAGAKDYTDDPDLIVHDGVAAVLVAE